MPVHTITAGTTASYYDGLASPPEGFEDFATPLLRHYEFRALIPYAGGDGRLLGFQLWQALRGVVAALPAPADADTTGIDAPGSVELSQMVHDGLVAALGLTNGCRVEVRVDEILGTTYSTLAGDQ